MEVESGLEDEEGTSVGATDPEVEVLKLANGKGTGGRVNLAFGSAPSLNGKCMLDSAKFRVPSVARTTMESMLAISRAGPSFRFEASFLHLSEL